MQVQYDINIITTLRLYLRQSSKPGQGCIQINTVFSGVDRSDKNKQITQVDPDPLTN